MATYKDVKKIQIGDNIYELGVPQHGHPEYIPDGNDNQTVVIDGVSFEANDPVKIVEGTNIAITANKAQKTATISVTGLATVATTGNYDDLTNKPSLTDATVKLSATIWTDKTIGYIQGTAASPKIVANAGDTLNTMFTNIFGSVEDDDKNLVTNPYISSVSIGSSSYEYGTKVNSVSVTASPVAGSYKYGPAETGSSWTGNYTFSGTGFNTKNNSSSNTQTVGLSATFTVGESSALTLTASRAYTAATTTAKSKMGRTTNQKIDAGTASKTGTFNPTAVKYVYYAVTSTTDKPSSWTLYDGGQTSVENLSITADAGKYVWIASTGNYSSIYAFNEVSGKYNTDATPTTKSTSQTITNSQGASASGYNLYRTTNAKALSGPVKYKLA